MNEAQRAKAHAAEDRAQHSWLHHHPAIIDLENVLRAIEPPRTGPNTIVRDPELLHRLHLRRSQRQARLGDGSSRATTSR